MWGRFCGLWLPLLQIFLANISNSICWFFWKKCLQLLLTLPKRWFSVYFCQILKLLFRRLLHFNWRCEKVFDVKCAWKRFLNIIWTYHFDEIINDVQFCQFSLSNPSLINFFFKVLPSSSSSALIFCAPLPLYSKQSKGRFCHWMGKSPFFSFFALLIRFVIALTLADSFHCLLLANHFHYSGVAHSQLLVTVNGSSTNCCIRINPLRKSSWMHTYTLLHWMILLLAAKYTNVRVQQKKRACNRNWRPYITAACLVLLLLVLVVKLPGRQATKEQTL